MTQPDAVQTCGQFPKRNNNKLGSKVVWGVRDTAVACLHADFEWFDLEQYPYYSTLKHFPVALDPATGDLLPIWMFDDPKAFVANYCGLMDMGRYKDGRQFWDGSRCLVGGGDRVVLLTDVTYVPLELDGSYNVAFGNFLGPVIDPDTGMLHPTLVAPTADPACALYQVSKKPQCNPVDCVVAKVVKRPSDATPKPPADLLPPVEEADCPSPEEAPKEG